MRFCGVLGMTNAVTVSAPSAVVVGAYFAVTGTVSPAVDTVQIQLAGQNTTLPTGVWFYCQTANGVFSGLVQAVAPGTWYVWAYDPLTGVSAVSGPVVVGAAGITDVPAVPVATATAASLLGGSAAGLTPDQLPAAAPAGDSDVLPVAQAASPKTLLGQTFGAIWTWVAGHLPGYLLPQVTIAANVNLTNSAHNGRILSVTATGVTITALLASLGPGFMAVLFNDSGSTVAVSGISLSSGTTIAAGACVLLTGRTVVGTLTISGRVI